MSVSLRRWSVQEILEQSICCLTFVIYLSNHFLPKKNWIYRIDRSCFSSSIQSNMRIWAVSAPIAIPPPPLFIRISLGLTRLPSPLTSTSAVQAHYCIKVPFTTSCFGFRILKPRIPRQTGWHFDSTLGQLCCFPALTSQPPGFCSLIFCITGSWVQPQAVSPFQAHWQGPDPGHPQLAGSSGEPGHQLARLATGQQEVGWGTKYWNWLLAPDVLHLTNNNKLHSVEGKTMALLIIVIMMTDSYRQVLWSLNFDCF